KIDVCPPHAFILRSRMFLVTTPIRRLHKFRVGQVLEWVPGLAFGSPGMTAEKALDAGRHHPSRRRSRADHAEPGAGAACAERGNVPHDGCRAEGVGG